MGKYKYPIPPDMPQECPYCGASFDHTILDWASKDSAIIKATCGYAIMINFFRRNLIDIVARGFLPSELNGCKVQNARDAKTKRKIAASISWHKWYRRWWRSFVYWIQA